MRARLEGDRKRGLKPTMDEIQYALNLLKGSEKKATALDTKSREGGKT